MEPQVEHEVGKRFFIATPAGDAYLLYERLHDGSLDFLSTFVPPPMRGRGLGELLIARAFEYARGLGARVVPTCPYVHTVADHLPEYRDLLI